VTVTDDITIDASAIYSPQLFNEAFIRRSGHDPAYQVASMMASFYTLHMAIVRANSTIPLTLMKEIATLYDSSFYGLISQDRFGQNSQKELTTLQYFSDLSLQLVTPLSAAEYQPVYPMPTWDERVYTPQLFNTVIEEVVVVLSGICFGMVILLVAFFSYHRNGQVCESIPFVDDHIDAIDMSTLSFPVGNARVGLVLLYDMYHGEYGWRIFHTCMAH
jgi:hypothetical protein